MLWLLRPKEGISPDPWQPWYNRCFGMVIRAGSEAEARMLIEKYTGSEFSPYGNGKNPWLSSDTSTCVPLDADGPDEVIMTDVESA
jgi:hypothetical protein